jgi:RNA polymerase sigma factor (sigma-70 family)
MRQTDESDPLPALMVRYQAGEMTAFEELYAALASPLRGYLRTLVAPGLEVEDLLQNAFLQMHRSRRSYQPGQPVKPWVYAIARNVGLMARRSSGRRAKRETLADDELPEVAVAAAGISVLDRLTLERLLEGLADPGREALWLHHVDGLSFREVGAVQGVSETAAKVRAHRALAELKQRATAEAMA